MSESTRTIEYIEVDKLDFDLQNPRLPTIVQIQKSKQAVLKWMLDEENIVELMTSIAQQGFFGGEALLAVPQDSNNDRYEVVEGNRRLAAVTLLNHPELAEVRKKAVLTISYTTPDEHKPKQLPVIVFQKRSEILSYLGYRHITGVQPWDALAKARYLKQLFSAHEKSGGLEEIYKSLASSIGSKPDYVRKLLTALAIYDGIEDSDFFGIKGLNEENISFSLITTALGYANIRAFLNLYDENYPEVTYKPEQLEELTRWVFEKDQSGYTRLGESRNLSQLAAIVEVPKALSSFRGGISLQEAAMLTAVPAEIFQRAIIEAKKRIDVANGHFHRVSDPTAEQASILNEIAEMANNMVVLIQNKLQTHEK